LEGPCASGLHPGGWVSMAAMASPIAGLMLRHEQLGHELQEMAKWIDQLQEQLSSEIDKHKATRASLESESRARRAAEAARAAAEAKAKSDAELAAAELAAVRAELAAERAEAARLRELEEEKRIAHLTRVAYRHVANMKLRRGYNCFIANCMERNRLLNLIKQATLRLAKPALSKSFSAWHEALALESAKDEAARLQRELEERLRREAEEAEARRLAHLGRIAGEHVRTLRVAKGWRTWHEQYDELVRIRTLAANVRKLRRPKLVASLNTWRKAWVGRALQSLFDEIVRLKQVHAAEMQAKEQQRLNEAAQRRLEKEEMEKRFRDLQAQWEAKRFELTQQIQDLLKRLAFFEENGANHEALMSHLLESHDRLQTVVKEIKTQKKVLNPLTGNIDTGGDLHYQTKRTLATISAIAPMESTTLPPVASASPRPPPGQAPQDRFNRGY